MHNETMAAVELAAVVHVKALHFESRADGLNWRAYCIIRLDTALTISYSDDATFCTVVCSGPANLVHANALPFKARSNALDLVTPQCTHSNVVHARAHRCQPARLVHNGRRTVGGCRSSTSYRRIDAPVCARRRAAL